MKLIRISVPRRASAALAVFTICAFSGAGNVTARVPAVPVFIEPDPVTAFYATRELNGVLRLAKDPSPAPDDTGRNVRDHEDQTLTPMDQSNDPRDVKLTQQIRKALMADKTLSTTAKNIKIITIGGKVTLRGPVTSTKERAKIAKKAKAIAKGRVDNQLEVTTR